jgi:hypothetical protein
MVKRRKDQGHRPRCWQLSGLIRLPRVLGSAASYALAAQRDPASPNATSPPCAHRSLPLWIRKGPWSPFSTVALATLAACIAGAFPAALREAPSCAELRSAGAAHPGETLAVVRAAAALWGIGLIAFSLCEHSDPQPPRRAAVARGHRAAVSYKAAPLTAMRERGREAHALDLLLLHHVDVGPGKRAPRVRRAAGLDSLRLRLRSIRGDAEVHALRGSTGRHAGGARPPGRAAASRDVRVLSDRLRVQVSGPGAGVHDDGRLVPPRPPPRPARLNHPETPLRRAAAAAAV